MKNISEQFNEATSNISLSLEDKLRMREKLVEYMEYKPIRSSTSLSKKEGYTSFLPYFHAHHFSGALMIALLVTSSTFGVSFAAGDALPGDLLYPVKVNVNEEIKTVFISSTESRIVWEQERAGRRLVEASQLAAEGRLDPEKQETVSKLFAEHTEAMVEQVLAAEETDPVLAAEMSSVFEDSLEAHEAVLARLIVEQEDVEEGRGLVEQVRTASMEVEKIRNNVEEKIAIDESEVTVAVSDQKEGEVAKFEDEQNADSANLRVRAAYRAQARASKLLSDVKELHAGLDAESQLAQQVQAQISSGEELMQYGAQALLENNLGDAYGKYRKASASLQNIEELLKVTNLFSVEIFPEEEVEVEENVDTKLDSEKEKYDEVTVDVETMRTQIREEIGVARKLLLSQEGQAHDGGQKANNQIKNASAHLLRGEIAMALKDYYGAKAHFEQALTLTSETVRSLESVSDIEELVEEVEVVVPEAEVVVPEVKPITIHHQYSEGTHKYTGTATVSNICKTLEKNVLVAESFPEQITLQLTTANREEGAVCAQVLGDVPFSFEVTASEHATITRVQLDGADQKWELVNDAVFHEEEKNDKKSASFFQSMFNTAE